MIVWGKGADQRAAPAAPDAIADQIEQERRRRVRKTRVAATSEITAATNADVGPKKRAGQDVDEERRRDC